MDDGEHSTDSLRGHAPASSAWAALDATHRQPSPLDEASDRAAESGVGIIHVAGDQLGPEAHRALAESARAARGHVLLCTKGAGHLLEVRSILAESGALHRIDAPITEVRAGALPAIAPAPLDALIRVDPSLARARSAARALRQADLPLAITSDIEADAAAFLRWCATLPGSAGADGRPPRHPPGPLDDWVGHCPQRAALAPRAWRLRRWARLALISRHRDDGIKLARALWGPGLVCANARDPELPAAIDRARGGTLLLAGLDRAAEGPLARIEGALSSGTLRLVALLPSWDPNAAWIRLCLQPLELPPTAPPPPPLMVVPPGHTPDDRALLRLPPLSAHSLDTVRTAAALLLHGRPLEDRAVRALARSAHGRADLVATLAALDRRLPAGPVTHRILRARAPHLADSTAGTPWIVRIPVATGGGGPAVRQEISSRTLRFSAEPGPGRMAIEGLPECFCEVLELRRSRTGMVAWLRQDLPEHVQILARPLERMTALPVRQDCPVQLGRAGVLELSWAPGITVELELYADSAAAEAQRPAPAPAHPLSPEECTVILGAVIAAAEGSLPWDEALPRALRRRVHSEAGRTAAGRLLTDDPVGALAGLLMSGSGEALRRSLGARIRSHETAAALHARLPRRVRRLLPPIDPDLHQTLAVVPDH